MVGVVDHVAGGLWGAAQAITAGQQAARAARVQQWQDDDACEAVHRLGRALQESRARERVLAARLAEMERRALEAECLVRVLSR